MAIAVVILTWSNFRASFQLEKLRDQAVLEASLELANERAARLDQLIIEQDNIVREEAEASPVNAIGKSWLSVAERRTPTVRAVLVMERDSGSHEVLVFASRVPGPDDENFRRLVVYRVLYELDLSGADPGQLRHLHGTYGEKSYLLSYWERLVGTNRYLVLVWHDVPRIVHDYLPWLYEEKDSQSRVNVVDGEGRIVYGPPLSGGEFAVGRHFQTTLYKWRLNVALTSAEELTTREARRRVTEMVLAGLSGLVVISGMIIVVVAAYRERRLANLKGEFVANVSHELKTPLALVRMFGELLQSGRAQSEEKQKQYLQIIVSESERLGALIENVLDFARADRGAAEYDFSDHSIAEVVLRAVEACRIRAEREDVALEVDVEPNLPVMRLDARAIEIAVINLVDNAIKYAGAGKRVDVSARRHAGTVRVVVSDRGPGIPADERQRIFQRFVRGKHTQQVRGSGIGLALVKHIAEAHGGDVWVDPSYRDGSRFVFSLKISGALQIGAER